MSEDPKITKDIAVPIGESEDGHPVLLRLRGTDERPLTVEVGELRPVEDGKPVMDEMVHLTQQEDGPNLDVEVIARGPASRRAGRCYSVPTEKFQAGWDRIFGSDDEPTIH
jgi:hypothetical protein